LATAKIAHTKIPSHEGKKNGLKTKDPLPKEKNPGGTGRGAPDF